MKLHFLARFFFGLPATEPPEVAEALRYQATPTLPDSKAAMCPEDGFFGGGTFGDADFGGFPPDDATLWSSHELEQRALKIYRSFGIEP